ncbi:hypothetical protein CcI49_36320 [Frankia sp. CcI49]|nr:cyclophilin-like fold protein [Frankia sp. CcI49]ONH51100.1 hypothetical protein CcI49_36320 [Frankia sp. CcI49]
MVVALAVAACGGSTDPAPVASSGVSSPSGPPAGDGTPAPSAAPSSTPTGVSQGTLIRIVIDGQVLDGRLWDNAPGRDLPSRLPVTLTFGDLSRQEKIGHLEQLLSMESMPAGDDPVPGDLGWYEPWGNVVLYYGDVAYWDGIARIGTIDSGTDLIEAQTGDFTAIIERADQVAALTRCGGAGHASSPGVCWSDGCGEFGERGGQP